MFKIGIRRVVALQPVVTRIVLRVLTLTALLVVTVLGSGERFFASAGTLSYPSSSAGLRAPLTTDPRPLGACQVR